MTKLGRPAAKLPATDSAREAWLAHRPRPGTGELARLAKALGLTQANFNHWDQVPKKHLNAVAAALGTEPRELRPDLFPPWAGLI